MRRQQFLILASVTLLVSLPHGAAATQNGKASKVQRVERYRLTQTGGGLGIYVSETAVFSASRDAPGDWFVERHRTDDDWCGHRENKTCAATSVTVHQWIASRSCPALRAVMTQLPAAQRAALAKARKEAGKHIYVTDTPLLTLETVRGVGRATQKQSEWLGPLADWWWSAEKQLKPCWRDYSE